MNYRDAAEKIAAYRAEITAIRERMRALQAATQPEAVQDYVFASASGPRPLSSLFGDKADLIVVHNMGIGCSYCTLWADGYNGVYPHLAARAAFAISSPDLPDVQAKFAAARGWRFPMVSHAGTSFAADMGYRNEGGGLRPGISVFRKEDGQILRVSDRGAEMHDDFCIVWHLFDLLPGGAAGWSPRLSYS